MANNRKAKRTILKLSEKNYRRILKNSKNYCRKLGLKRIPLPVFDKIVDLACITPDDDAEQFVFEFADKYNTTLTTLKRVCKTQSNVIGDNAVSIFEIELFINELIKSLREGANEDMPIPTE